MASITSYLSKPPSSSSYSFSTSTNKTNLVNNYNTHTQFLQPFITKHTHTPTKFNNTTKNRRGGGGGAPSFVTTTSTRATAAPGTGTKKAASDERVQKIHSKEEFDEALKTAKDKLVVVEYAASHSENSKKIYPFLVELSKQCGDVEFLLVMGDESDKTRELCRRENVDKVPHFSFYKSMEKIHEEEAIGPDQLRGDVLYYGDNHSAVVQLHSGEDVKQLIDGHKTDDKLIVLDVGLKHCGPCVKVYPTVLKLSRQMTETVVFARMNGDENESCMNFLREMNVIEVPTFLFIRDGKVRGRYVGSGKGELIGEILRYQGVRVTY